MLRGRIDSLTGSLTRAEALRENDRGRLQAALSLTSRLWCADLERSVEADCSGSARSLAALLPRVGDRARSWLALPSASSASLCASRCAGPSKRCIGSLISAGRSDSGATLAAISRGLISSLDHAYLFFHLQLGSCAAKGQALQITRE
jgi:hypothetical protein